MESATFPNGFVVNDGAYDSATNPEGLANGGSRYNLLLAFQALIDTFNRTVDAAGEAEAFAITSTTSATSRTIGTGSLSFVMATALPLVTGQFVLLASAANPLTHWMWGQVSSRVGTALTVDVQVVGAGTGSRADWIIQMSGARGATGAAGGVLSVAGKTGAVSLVAADVSGVMAQGLHTMFFAAGGITPRSTNGPARNTIETTTNKINLALLDFDASTAEYAQIIVGMPKSWNAGTITAQFGWTAASGSGAVVWGIRGVAMSDDDVIDTAFGTAVTVTDTLTAVGDIMVSAATSAVTISNTPAKSDTVVFEVYRDAAAGGDTLAVDARLLWVKIFVTLDASTDA